MQQWFVILCYDFNDFFSMFTKEGNLPARNGITNKVQSQGEGQGTRNQQNGKCGACEALVRMSNKTILTVCDLFV